MVYLIGVSGGTASGKTSTCSIIAKILNHQIQIVSMDSFYLDFADRDPTQIDFDHPSSFDWPLLTKVLIDLKQKKDVDIPNYDFKTHSRTGYTTIQSTDCVIFEGILTFYDETVRNLFDMKIFVDTPADIRMIRRIRRDIQDRGRTLESVLNQCEYTVIPSHDSFIEPTKRYADLILPRGKTNVKAISLLAREIQQYIESSTS